MGKYAIKNIKKSFEDLIVLDDLSIAFEKGSITCILGPSGCGKSTLLNIITGIIQDYEGEVIGFSKEEISFIFQEDRLIPWLSVYDNMKLVLKSKYKDQDLKQRILDYITMIGMADYISFYPPDLSGGMKQRVSIARALAYGGNIIIMDEPFKSLDLKSKMQLLKDFKKICRQTKATVIFVTHDIDEAIELGDYICVLSDKPTYIKKIWKDIGVRNLRKELLSQII
ncbi:MAG TPA: ABC transporter ATP-binding protein [Epulopiscium sp.]|nr:ABC transporter ATP-binding protein [Candidatus Epulonipiscium sp.]